MQIAAILVANATRQIAAILIADAASEVAPISIANAASQIADRLRRDDSDRSSRRLGRRRDRLHHDFGVHRAHRP